LGDDKSSKMQKVQKMAEDNGDGGGGDVNNAWILEITRLDLVRRGWCPGKVGVVSKKSRVVSG